MGTATGPDVACRPGKARVWVRWLENKVRQNIKMPLSLNSYRPTASTWIYSLLPSLTKAEFNTELTVMCSLCAGVCSSCYRDITKFKHMEECEKMKKSPVFFNSLLTAFKIKTEMLTQNMIAVRTSVFPLRSPVNELVDDDDISRLDLLSQWAAGCGGQQMCTAFFSERPDVGPVVHVCWHYGVLSPMSTFDTNSSSYVGLQLKTVRSVH